jgi:glycosyltransferase involved in cell wall biosynthesis
VTAAPRVAVIVPCFDDGALIEETLASIDEPEPVELVVVDDASTDPETRAVLARLGAGSTRVIRHEVNRGLPAARMSGLAATRAPYVFPLDADDLLLPGVLAAMADRLDAEPGAAVCFGDYEEFGHVRRVKRVPARLDPYRVAFRNDYPVSSLFRREALEAAGGWRAVGSGVGYEDWQLWMTLAERGASAVHLGRIGYRRRLHGERMLSHAGRSHRRLYAELRRGHPGLFGALAEHRRRSDLPAAHKLLYPLVFGARPPSGLLTRLRRLRPGRRQAP